MQFLNGFRQFCLCVCFEFWGVFVCRLCRAMGGAEKVEIERGNHSLSNRIEEAVHAIMEIVRRDGPKGCEDPWS